ncbi:helix-turn-helix domain-containing protein [Clostridium tyrobutyricum]|uniref:helix-turn-helix domain-containing protein n=1 Tax=Clostridium tyrobutyricum TaxID=1519 RepID=UPI0018A0E6B5|nr:helix-turn-helix domain-containing protein [Clostridium tyrobutyricum]
MDKKDAKLIGKRIKTFRNSAGLTQEQLAKKTTISLSAIGKYEIGERTPKYETLEEIAKALHVSTGELMGHSEVRKIADKKRVPTYNYLLSEDEKSNLDDDIVKEYAPQFNEFSEIIRLLKATAKPEQLIKMLDTITQNFNRLLEDMDVLSKLTSYSDEEFNNILNRSRYQDFHNFIPEANRTKLELLKNIDELLFLFFELRYDYAIKNANYGKTKFMNERR